MISTKTIWIAIFRIFKDADVGIGQAISLHTLMRQWSDTHLRQGDLAQGLDTLARAGLISLDMSEQGPQVHVLDDRFNKDLTPDEGERIIRSLNQLSWRRKSERETSEQSGEYDIQTRREKDFKPGSP